MLLRQKLGIARNRPLRVAELPRRYACIDHRVALTTTPPDDHGRAPRCGQGGQSAAANPSFYWNVDASSLCIATLILAQRASRIRAETDDPAQTIDKSGEKPLGLDRRRVVDWHRVREPVGRTLHAAAANVQSIISRLVLRNCDKGSSF